MAQEWLATVSARRDTKAAPPHHSVRTAARIDRASRATVGGTVFVCTLAVPVGT